MARKCDNYGDHPTRFSNLTDDELYRYYRQSQWDGLSSADRLELMQETVNRSAEAHDEVGSCEVRWMESDSYRDIGGTLGQQTNGVIEVNEHYFSREADWLEDTRIESFSSLKALETVLHEDEHAYQEQVVQGIIPAQDPHAAREYMANGFLDENHGPAIVERPDGNLANGSQYISARSDGSRMNYYVYMAQSTERDAFRFSQQKAAEIVERQQELMAQEQQGRNNKSVPYYLTHMDDAVIARRDHERMQRDLESFAKYTEYVQENGYEATMEMAEEYTHNPHFEEDVNTVLTNKYYGENVPLNKPDMELTVNNEMAESYKFIYCYQSAQHLQVNSIDQASSGQSRNVRGGIEASSEYAGNAMRTPAINHITTLGFSGVGQGNNISVKEEHGASGAQQNSSSLTFESMGSRNNSGYGQTNDMDYDM